MYTESELKQAHSFGLMVGGFVGFGFGVTLCLIVGFLFT